MNAAAHNTRPSTELPSAAELHDLLEQVTDPEIPVISISELGILRGVAIDQNTVVVTITPTYSGCPAMHEISNEIKTVLHTAGIEKVKVELQLTPCWTTEWMSENGKSKLLEYGIAPPLEKGQAEQGHVQCPQCGSTETTKISEFGSTACKALYKCQTCHEPFDYFKCL